MKDVKEEKKCPCEQCVHGTYMIVEKEWWCDKHLKYAGQMERNRLYEKFETISGDENEMTEIGCWNCVLDGIKNGKPVCPECGTEIAPLCKEYSHEKIWVKKLEQEPYEDAISRKAVLDMATTVQTDDCSGNEVMKVVDVDDIKTLPPVIPPRKKEMHRNLEWPKLREGFDKIYRVSL